MHQRDGMARRSAVEIVPRRVSALGDQRVVVAVAEHPFAGRHLAFGDPFAQQAHDTVDVRDGTDGR